MLSSIIKKQRIFTKNLKKWGKENIRDFIWRDRDKNPYEVFIAEVFLKRTTSSHVIKIYEDFISNYSSYSDIEKEEKEILIHKLKNLGLQNQRVSQLKQMCKYIVENYKGKLPKDEEKLLMIPGVGQYISRSILCFAYNIRSYPIDSNVQRVISRIFLSKEWKSTQFSEIEEIFKTIQPTKNFRHFNYLLLDFGSIICRPSNPKCSFCPFTEICNYFKFLS